MVISSVAGAFPTSKSVCSQLTRAPHVAIGCFLTGSANLGVGTFGDAGDSFVADFDENANALWNINAGKSDRPTRLSALTFDGQGGVLTTNAVVVGAYWNGIVGGVTNYELTGATRFRGGTRWRNRRRGHAPRKRDD
jgi:hypothetical protein